jgi:hypothetical protein
VTQLPDWRLIVPYYDNPRMLELQRRNWDRYCGELRRSLRIIVVDDCSPEPAAPILEGCRADVEVYRLAEDIPWNMHQCRNIGAKEACSRRENLWLFMTDMDTLLTPEAAYTMMSKPLDPWKHYTVARAFAPDFLQHKTHVNTFLVQHAPFWMVNGYDVDLTPAGSGGYGGDHQFLHQLRILAAPEHRGDVMTIGFGRRSIDGAPIFPDADTQAFDRIAWQAKFEKALKAKEASGDMRSIDPIRVAYERVL